MVGAPVIPPPRDDDDDDVAWALQTAAVQWNRGAQEDAVVWLRRAVDAAITAGNPDRTRELNRLATTVAAQITGRPIGDIPTLTDPSRDLHAVDELLRDEPRLPYQRAPQKTLSDQIPIDVDADAVELDDHVEDDLTTIPPSAIPNPFAARNEPHEAEPLGDADLEPSMDSPFSEPDDAFAPRTASIPIGENDLEADALDEQGRLESEDTFDPMFSDDLEASYTSGVRFDSSEVSQSIPVGEDDLEPEEDLDSDAEATAVVRFPNTLKPIVEPPSAHGDNRAPPKSAVDPLGQTMPGIGLRKPAADPLARTMPGTTVERREIPTPAATASEPAEPAESAQEEEPHRRSGGAEIGRPLVDGIGLDEASGFEDLPEDAQHALVEAAKLDTLSVNEEVGAFAAALVTHGSVGVMPAIADVAGGIARPGDVVFTRGTLEDGIVLRVVALEDETRVASWNQAALDAATSDCPWVADELRAVADRFQALGGATLGLLGDRLDDSLRSIVTDRLTVRYLAPFEVIVEQGKPVPGLHVVGAGRVEMLQGESVTEEFAPGDILFAAEVMSAGVAHATARAGESGALVLFAPRSVAHELMVSVPPLLEILAS